MYKILIVEDDSAMRFIYSKMKVWTEHGFQITDEAANGKDALELLSKNKYDLVISDIRMPFLDGIELLREIKNRSIDVCVIFVSSYDEFEYARQGLVLGAFDYILKPLKESQLVQSLERVKDAIVEKKQNREFAKPVLSAMQRTGVDIGNKTAYQFCEYLSENFEKIITMDEMAEQFNLSKDYFGKIFKQNMNAAFSYFYTLVKMEYAKELLITGNYKTYQISEMLGYSSVDYFSKVFKEYMGETPSRFKQNTK
ncbi:MAG: response regulator [Oscillospiraceae bacterium]